MGLDFQNVHERVRELTTSVLYDRAGTGWSEPVRLPRSAAAVAEELRDLLRAEQVPGPYVLVGHSLGAFYARRFVQLFPGEVAGLLLLDPGHEDIMDFMPAEAAELNERMKPDLDQLPELTAEQADETRKVWGEVLARWPDGVREKLVDYHVTQWRVSVEETLNFESEIYGELRAGGALPELPTIVITAGGRNPYWAQFMTEEQMAQALDGIRAMHATAFPGEHRELDGASHQFLHIEQEDAVVQAIADVLSACRDRG